MLSSVMPVISILQKRPFVVVLVVAVVVVAKLNSLVSYTHTFVGLLSTTQCEEFLISS